MPALWLRRGAAAPAGSAGGNRAGSPEAVLRLNVIPLEAFRDKISFGVAIAAVERGFRALGLGQATLPDPMVLELRDLSAEIHVKGAHLAGDRHIVLKLATGFYNNPARGLPSGDGLFLLLDATTGAPVLLLAEHGYLTDLRTAAAVGLTLKYFAPKNTHDALLVGSGAVGRLAARAIVAQLPLERLTIWNRTPERAEALAADLTASGVVQARVARAIEPEVRRQRVIVTATASTAPLIKTAWVANGTHITSVGTGSPEKVELEPALLAKADKVVADRLFQTERYGNLHHSIAAGIFTANRVYGELADLAAGRLPGRETEGEITIADLTGVGVQDAAIAAVVVETLGL
ncbi:MAG: ornithine cyclodeaminase family protein [Gemmatimonadales bacterium]